MRCAGRMVRKMVLILLRISPGMHVARLVYPFLVLCHVCNRGQFSAEGLNV